MKEYQSPRTEHKRTQLLWIRYVTRISCSLSALVPVKRMLRHTTLRRPALKSRPGDTKWIELPEICALSIYTHSRSRYVLVLMLVGKWLDYYVTQLTQPNSSVHRTRAASLHSLAFRHRTVIYYLNWYLDKKSYKIRGQNWKSTFCLHWSARQQRQPFYRMIHSHTHLHVYIYRPTFILVTFISVIHKPETKLKWNS